MLGTKWDENEPQFVKYYITNPDIVYSAKFPLPRIAGGPFTLALELIFEKIYSRKIETIIYGKPTLNTFKYAEREIRSRVPEIEKFYMIGDNPAGDIRGANLAGWESILVWTGLFDGPENDPKDPAKYVVDSFKDAIQTIFEKERVN